MPNHYSLSCPRSHAIPIPPPTQVETDGSRQETTKEVKRAIFACPDCGYVSAYSESDVQEAHAPQPDLFLSKKRDLVSIQVDCDGKNCEVPKEIYIIAGTVEDVWTPKAVPKDWEFADTARCSRGHKLAIRDKERFLYQAHKVASPFYRKSP